jgi:hypothetical protein
MAPRAHGRTLALAAALLLLCSASFSAFAECPAATVRQMASQGKTIAAIARTCKISKDDVQSIVDEDEDKDGSDDDSGKPGGLPPGAPVGQCGCWGYVSPAMRQPHPACRSGYAKPAMCNTMCPAGGYAWRGVCG